MDKEKVFEKSRNENNDEGNDFFKMKASTIGFLGVSIIVIFIYILNLFTKHEEYNIIVMPIFWMTLFTKFLWRLLL